MLGEPEADEWVKSAMANDTVVAHFLMHLKNSVPPPPHPPPPETKLHWGVRLPRSRQVLVGCCSKKKDELTRASPTTPLSWSGGASFSGDACEESSGKLNVGGSKVIGTGELTNRRSRKKKTFAELKEAESFLLNERIHLRKELATLRYNFEKETSINKSLKRKEVDLEIQPVKRACMSNAAKELAFDESLQADVGRIPTTLPTGSRCQELDVAVTLSGQPSTSREAQEKEDAPSQSLFMLPDLNLPLDEDSGSEELYGMS